MTPKLAVLLVAALPYLLQAAPVIPPDSSLAAETARALDVVRKRHPAADFRSMSVKRSLAGTHVAVVQFIEGVEVVNSGGVVTLRNDGGIETSTREAAAASPRGIRPMAIRNAVKFGVVVRSRDVFYAIGSEAVRAREEITLLPSHEYVVSFLATSDGALLAQHPLSFRKRADVFIENPVTTLNLPTLRDDNDSATAVPFAAYSSVEIDAEVVDGRLRSESVEVIDDFLPLTPPIDANASLQFNRDDPRFEEVMSFFHIERSKRRLQELGYRGALEILDRPVVVDAHGTTDDRSIYTAFPPGEGKLLFGDGGVDDAEDPDVINHELAHVIHDAIIPGVLAGPSSGEPRALAEGFADYWAFSMSYEGARGSGRDPYCVGDWDARCGGSPSDGCAHPPATDCLRRVDSARKMSEYVRTNRAGVEYDNGAIWSSFLVSIFNAFVAEHGVQEGRLRADRLIVEGLFGMPANPTFATAAARIAAADVSLHGGTHLGAICDSSLTRGIVASSSACRSDSQRIATMYAGTARNVQIPDGAGVTLRAVVSDDRLIEKIQVMVDIEHEHRGDLRLTLIDPRGNRFLLQQTSASDADEDVFAIFGLDSMPVDSFEPLLGASARGEWMLEVIDTAAEDRGAVHDWAILLTLAGTPDNPGPPSLPHVDRYVIAGSDDALVGRRSNDLYLTNRTMNSISIEISFAAEDSADREVLRVELPTRAASSLRDVVRRYFGREEDGVLRVLYNGDLQTDLRTIITAGDVRRTARVPKAEDDTTTAKSEAPLHLIGLEPGERRPVRVLLAEVSGQSAVVVNIDFVSLSGSLMEQRRVELDPGDVASLDVTTIDSARAIATVVSGDGELYGVTEAMLLNSGDVNLIPAAQALPARNLVVEAGRVDLAGGRQWGVELLLSNTTTTTFLVPFRYAAAGRVERELTLVLAAGETRRLRDVVGIFAGPFTSLGHIEVDVPAGVIAAAQLRNSAVHSAVYEALEWRNAESLLTRGEQVTHPFVESDASTRSNVGLTEMSGRSVGVAVAFLSASGEVLSIIHAGLAPDGALQLAVPEFTSSVRVEVIDGEGSVAVGVSVIDRVSTDSAYTALAP